MKLQSPEEHLDEVRTLAHKRDLHQPEYLQAVDEVFDSLLPVLHEHPEYVENRVLERLIEPE